MKKSILLSVLLMAGLVHADPFQGQYATSPKACYKNSSQLSGDQYNVTFKGQFVTMFGWNYIRVERIEELGVYTAHDLTYAGHFIEQWETEETNGVSDTTWSYHNGVLKRGNAPAKLRKCK